MILREQERIHEELGGGAIVKIQMKRNLITV